MTKKFLIAFVLSSLLANFAFAQSQSRSWKDSSGHYEFEGKMIARDDNRIVIEKDDKSLMSVELSQLSEADRTYLDTNKDKHLAMADEVQEWHLENGVTIKGAVVEYGSRTIELRKVRGKTYVNDKLFTNLPELYQQIIPQLVAKVEQVDIAKHPNAWKRKLKTAPKGYQAEGVKLEVENGDLYTIPLFMFTAQDRKILEPGLDSWAKSQPGAHVERDMHSLNLRARVLSNKAFKSQKSQKAVAASGSGSQPTAGSASRPSSGSNTGSSGSGSSGVGSSARAIANSQTDDISPEEEIRRVARLQLQLTAYDAGLFALWEVRLEARNGEWRAVIVPGRDSYQAQENARAEFPGVETRILSSRKLRRK